MAILGKYFKAPEERKVYTIDYTDWLDQGELITNVTFKITPTTGTPVNINEHTINPNFKGITFFARDGTIGVTYKTAVTITTSNGQVKEDIIQFTVKAA